MAADDGAGPSFLSSPAPVLSSPAPVRSHPTSQFGELGDVVGHSGPPYTSRDPADADSESQTDSEEEHLTDEDVESVTSQTYQVNTHPHTQRKLIDWHLEVYCKWLIVGDSNLARLTDHDVPDLQIDSFPGAHFRHAQALFEKTVPTEGVVVETIILSFGINSRANKSKETTIRNAQAALRAARNRFPSAQVLVQQLNFSKNLPAEEQQNLLILNDHVERNMSYIPPLPDDQFSTQDDNIHWTSATCKAFLDLWRAVLNRMSP